MIENLINQAVSYVTNYDYAEAALKVAYKTASFLVERGMDLIMWANQ